MIHIVKVLEDNYSYLLKNNSKAIVVDPGESKPLLDLADDLKIPISHILLTHNHFDHSGGVGEILNRFPSAKLLIA